MNTEKFLQELLASQELLPEQLTSLEAHKDEVTKYLRQEFGLDPKIKYAGSFAKHTMIRESYDLDIVCYFPSTDTRTLKEIRDDVGDHMKSAYLVEDKSTAVRITNLKGDTTPHSYHIDVVPGRTIEGSDDVFLHVKYGDKERMQTNLKTHIDNIRKSECEDVIKLVKLWACRNNLHIKTFVLEQFVIKALDGSPNKKNLTLAFTEVMEAFKDKFGSVQLVDPANTNNIVSQLVTPSEKVMTSSIAETTYNRISESEDIADWQGAFLESSIGSNSSASASAAVAATAYTAGSSFKPTRQWGC